MITAPLGKLVLDTRLIRFAALPVKINEYTLYSQSVNKINRSRSCFIVSYFVKLFVCKDLFTKLGFL